MVVRSPRDRPQIAAEGGGLVGLPVPGNPLDGSTGRIGWLLRLAARDDGKAEQNRNQRQKFILDVHMAFATSDKMAGKRKVSNLSLWVFRDWVQDKILPGRN